MTPPAGAATAVSIYHPVEDEAGFDAWLGEQLAAARHAVGFRSARISVHDEPQLDWASAVTFDTEDSLHSWLDGRKDSLRDGAAKGYLLRSVDVVLVEGQQAPAGAEAFQHSVTSGRETEFTSTQLRLAAASAALSGFEGTALFSPGDGDQWLSVVRFRTPAQLAAWMSSDERAAALGDLRTSLTKEFAPLTSTTPFATTVRTENGRTVMTPNWKSALMVLLVLYPTVMLLSRFVGPVFDHYGAQPWLALWLSQVLSVCLMQWWLMPLVSKPFRRWLDPVDGNGWRTSFIGAAVILACYVVTLLIFASVQWLQFWDYNS